MLTYGGYFQAQSDATHASSPGPSGYLPTPENTPQEVSLPTFVSVRHLCLATRTDVLMPCKSVSASPCSAGPGGFCTAAHGR